MASKRPISRRSRHRSRFIQTDEGANQNRPREAMQNSFDGMVQSNKNAKIVGGALAFVGLIIVVVALQMLGTNTPPPAHVPPQPTATERERPARTTPVATSPLITRVKDPEPATIEAEPIHRQGPVATTGGNLLKNGSWETLFGKMPAGWERVHDWDQNAAIEILDSPGVAREGKRFLAFDAGRIAAENDPLANVTIMTPVERCESELLYFSLKARGENAGARMFAALYVGRKGNVDHYSVREFPVTSGWSEYDGLFEVPDWNRQSDMKFCLALKPGSKVLIDDVKLFRVAKSSPVKPEVRSRLAGKPVEVETEQAEIVATAKETKPDGQTKEQPATAEKTPVAIETGRAKPPLGDIKPGEVTPRIKCSAKESVSYALYLPKDYSHERKLPVVYCFSDNGDGLDAVQRFKEACEEAGYIGVGPHIEKDGRRFIQAELIKSIHEAVFKDVYERFAIIEKANCAGGYAVGARIAFYVAYNYSARFNGLLALGTLAPLGDELKHFSRTTHQMIFGLFAQDDFQQANFFLSENNIRARKMPYWTEYYDGGNAWPPANRIALGLRLAKIHAMQRKIMPMDDELIRQCKADTLKEAEQFLADGKKLAADQRLAQMSRFFDGDVYAGKIAELRKKLVDDQELKADLATRRELIDFITFLSKPIDIQRRKEVFDRVDKALGIAARPGAFQTPMSRYLQNYLSQLQLLIPALINQKKHAEAMFFSDLACHLNPQDGTFAYNRACAYSVAGKKTEAVEMLKKAVELGYRDVNHIKQDKDLDNIRKEPGYIEIVKQLGG